MHICHVLHASFVVLFACLHALRTLACHTCVVWMIWHHFLPHFSALSVVTLLCFSLFKCSWELHLSALIGEPIGMHACMCFRCLHFSIMATVLAWPRSVHFGLSPLSLWFACCCMLGVLHIVAPVALHYACMHYMVFRTLWLPCIEYAMYIALSMPCSCMFACFSHIACLPCLCCIVVWNRC